MINKLFDKFSQLAIGQTVYLHTRRSTDIDDTSDDELQAIYLLFFPKLPNLSEQLIIVKNEEILKRHRANILTIATRLGIKELDSWDKFNNWMLLSSICKKKLNDHNLEELKALEIQFRAAQVNYDRSSLKPGTKAWFHKNKLIPPSEN